MKTFISMLIVGLVLSMSVTDFAPAAGDNTVALAIKVVQDVSRKPADLDWTKAKKGDFLYSGDQVRTGDRSIAIVKFKDNSMLRVRENAELKVFGEVKEGIFSKTVHVDRGQFTFDVQRQQNEQFTFTSPTSVASIRGTQGSMNSNQGTDMVTVVRGLVNLLNTFSNNSTDVNAGQTGLSRRDGTIEVRDATSAETNQVNNDIRTARGTGTEKHLEIELNDDQGNKKLMRIRYRD